ASLDIWRASSVLVVSLFFFFSSRRRHTRSKRDWSSDVCSSDLVLVAARITGRQPLGELLAGRAMGTAAPAVGLARTAARRIRGRTITAWAHDISSGWTGVVSMQQGAP